MKYIIVSIFIFTIWLYLTLNLIIERIAKALYVFGSILFHFTIKKEWFDVFSKYHVFFFDYPSYNTLKEYYTDVAIAMWKGLLYFNETKNGHVGFAEQGKTFTGEPLTEENLSANQLVFYEGKTYITGNRAHGMVELWIRKVSDKRVLHKVVPMNEIKLYNEPIKKIVKQKVTASSGILSEIGKDFGGCPLTIIPNWTTVQFEGELFDAIMATDGYVDLWKNSKIWSRVKIDQIQLYTAPHPNPSPK